MAEQTTALAPPWQDILPPLAPPPLSPWWLASALVLLLLAVSVVYILWQQRPRQRALRELRRYARQLRQAQPDLKQLVIALQRQVLQGLGLTPTTALARSHKLEAFWALYYEQLQRCVFSDAPPSAEEVARLLRQGQYWLRNYPR